MNQVKKGKSIDSSPRSAKINEYFPPSPRRDDSQGNEGQADTEVSQLSQQTPTKGSKEVIINSSILTPDSTPTKDQEKVSSATVKDITKALAKTAKCSDTNGHPKDYPQVDSPRPSDAKQPKAEDAGSEWKQAGYRGRRRGRGRGKGSSTGGGSGTKASQPKPRNAGNNTTRHNESRNTLVTDFFPVRRSARRTAGDCKKEKQRELEEAILDKREDGLKVVEFDGKGRGVVAAKHFKKGDFVVEYAGDIIDVTTAKEREQKYSMNPEFGCYMYYFNHKNKNYCVDATAESGRLGRLLNHSRSGNCCTKVVGIGDQPYLILVAAKDIQTGEELLYDYGDRSKSSLEAHPWLAK